MSLIFPLSREDYVTGSKKRVRLIFQRVWDGSAVPGIEPSYALTTERLENISSDSVYTN